MAHSYTSNSAGLKVINPDDLTANTPAKEWNDNFNKINTSATDANISSDGSGNLTAVSFIGDGAGITNVAKINSILSAGGGGYGQFILGGDTVVGNTALDVGACPNATIMAGNNDDYSLPAITAIDQTGNKVYICTGSSTEEDLSGFGGTPFSLFTIGAAAFDTGTITTDGSGNVTLQNLTMQRFYSDAATIQSDGSGNLSATTLTLNATSSPGSGALSAVSVAFDGGTITTNGSGGLKLADYSVVAAPVEGMVAWNYTTHALTVYNGAAWS